MAGTAVVWMVFSTLGLWAMGPIMALGLQKTIWYYLAVQFFLHFQFNGWYLFGVLALLFKFCEEYGIGVSQGNFNWFYRLLLVSCPITFALAVAWSKPHMVVFWSNSVGVTIQLLSVLFLIKLYGPIHSFMQSKPKNLTFLLLQLALFCVIAKCILQFAVAVPAVATIAYTIRNYVIGFIHLLLLGGITFGLLAIGNQQQLLSTSNKVARSGVYLLVMGFILMEIILFIQGTMFWGAQGFIPFYYEILFISSMLLPAGILSLLSGQAKRVGL